MTFELNNAIVWDGTEQQLKDFFGDRFQEYDPVSHSLILTDASVYHLDATGQSLIYLDGSMIGVVWLPYNLIREVNLPESVMLEETCHPSELTELEDRLLSLVEDGFRGLIKNL